MNELYNGMAASLMSKSADALSNLAGRLTTIGGSGLGGALVGGGIGTLTGGVAGLASGNPNPLKDALYGGLIGAGIGGVGGGLLGNRGYTNLSEALFP